mmetsp:Transcript_19519/g.57600  ORF Transcript_19519/g.57600 Transcript_19519/m.57600 type:complete len:321 (-) Transcript_19519:166-1128(-)
MRGQAQHVPDVGVYRRVRLERALHEGRMPRVLCRLPVGGVPRFGARLRGARGPRRLLRQPRDEGRVPLHMPRLQPQGGAKMRPRPLHPARRRQGLRRRHVPPHHEHAPARRIWQRHRPRRVHGPLAHHNRRLLEPSRGGRSPSGRRPGLGPIPRGRGREQRAHLLHRVVQHGHVPRGPDGDGGAGPRQQAHGHPNGEWRVPPGAPVPGGAVLRHALGPECPARLRLGSAPLHSLFLPQRRGGGRGHALPQRERNRHPQEGACGHVGKRAQRRPLRQGHADGPRGHAPAPRLGQVRRQLLAPHVPLPRAIQPRLRERPVRG